MNNDLSKAWKDLVKQTGRAIGKWCKAALQKPINLLSLRRKNKISFREAQRLLKLSNAIESRTPIFRGLTASVAERYKKGLIRFDEKLPKFGSGGAPKTKENLPS